MSNIREWTVVSHPEAAFVRFERPRVPTFGTARVVHDNVSANEHGVVSYTIESDGETVELNSGDTDVVLAAIFRRAGIVDDLRAVLKSAERDGDWYYLAAQRIRKVLGEAVS